MAICLFSNSGWRVSLVHCSPKQNQLANPKFFARQTNGLPHTTRLQTPTTKPQLQEISGSRYCLPCGGGMNRIKEFDGVKIQGTEEFCKVTTRALCRLRESSSYRSLILPNLGVIQHVGRSWFKSKSYRSDMDIVFSPTNVVRVYATMTVLAEIDRYAIGIAHEAYHSHLFERITKLGGKRVWRVHRRFRAHRDEIRCIRFQLKTCSELGVDGAIMSWLEEWLTYIPDMQMPECQIATAAKLRRILRNK